MPTKPVSGKQVKHKFTCACDEEVRTACTGEVFFREHEGRQFCVLHYPGKDKIEAFNVVIQKKLRAQDFDFRGVWFPEPIEFRNFEFNTVVHFENAVFSSEVSFVGANFSDQAHFWWVQFNARAYFNGAKFKFVAFTSANFYDDVIFTGASFLSATFGGVTFNKNVYFERALFLKQANFGLATFKGNAEFRGATFGGVALFLYSTFASYLRFTGDKHLTVFGTNSYLNLQHAQVEKPERVSFHALTLRPHWFINVDARKFEFVDVRWPQLPRMGPEIESLRIRQVSSSHRLLSIAYRQLAINAEENHRYAEAAEFRYGSMEIRRLEWLRGGNLWARQWRILRKIASRLRNALRNEKGFRGRARRRLWRFFAAYGRGQQVLHWFYWAASGYGERITRAAGCLLLILVLFAGLYTQVGFMAPADQTTKAAAMTTTPDTVGTPLHFTQALVYSFEVSILQKPEPKPLTLAARFLVGLETVLGPLQAALLALAIRRKFMR